MATRAKIARKVYVINGEDKRHAEPGVESLRFEFYDPAYSGDEADRPLLDGETLTLSANDVQALPENIRDVLAWHGLAQKVGDAYAGQAKDDAQSWDLAGAMWEALQAGTWVKKGESAGPRASILLEALERIATARGVEVTDDLRKKFAESIATPEQKKAAKANPAVAAEVAKIEQERAAARAKDAARKAKEAGDEAGDFLAGIMG